VRPERLGAGEGPAAVAARLRALVADGAAVKDPVAEIVDAVRRGGDRALLELIARHDGAPVGALRVDPHELDAAGGALAPDVRAGLELAVSNVTAVSRGALSEDREVVLAQGQRVLLREVAVASAGIYVPGGRAPYPSTVVMGVVAARVAGVARIAVCAPGADPLVLGACALCGISEVYRMGGAHAVAALAYGTESVARVDVIAGPGSLWVQEAKRQVCGDVGIDGFLGPSDLLILAGADADPDLVALDLLAQAEHGPGTIVGLISAEVELLNAVARCLESRAGPSPGAGAACALVTVTDPEAGLEVAEAFAPEHLELMGAEVERLAPRVRRAGCVLVGREGATAFADYVAGSNHSLPTQGAARFASGLSPRHFRRRLAEIHIGDAAGALARAGAPLARAEGFGCHAASMEARAQPIGDNQPL